MAVPFDASKESAQREAQPFRRKGASVRRGRDARTHRRRDRRDLATRDRTLTREREVQLEVKSRPLTRPGLDLELRIHRL